MSKQDRNLILFIGILFKLYTVASLYFFMIFQTNPLGTTRQFFQTIFLLSNVAKEKATLYDQRKKKEKWQDLRFNFFKFELLMWNSLYYNIDGFKNKY